MSAPTTTNRTSPVNALIEALEHVLNNQQTIYKRLLDCLDRKREAIRHARIDEIATIVQEEQQLVQQAVGLDRQRVEVTRRLSGELGFEGESGVTVTRLADAAPDEHAGARLREAGQALRDVVMRVKESGAIAREAAQTLASHVGGLMQHVHNALSRAGVYGQQGRITQGAQLDFNVDVKS